MTHPFEIRKEIEIAAPVEEVWEAIATGPGIDGWFLGVGNTVEPRVGGQVVLDFGGGQGVKTVTAWEPPRHFAYGGDPDPDGTLHAFDFEIEGRGDVTVLRIVHSGFLADDWEKEYDALNEGDAMYWHQIAQYVLHFRGRTPVLLSLARPDEPDRARAVGIFRAALGLDESARLGDHAAIDVDGLATIEGEVDFLTPAIIGIRTADALYRFAHIPQGFAFIGHRFFGDDVDLGAVAPAWQAWLDRSFGTDATA